MLWVNVEAAMVVALSGATPHVRPVLEVVARRLVGRVDTLVTWIGDNAPTGCASADVDDVVATLTAAPKPTSTSVVARRQGIPQPLAVIVAADVPAPQRARLAAAVKPFGSDRGVALLTSWDTPDAAPEFRWSMPSHGTIDIPSMVTLVTVDGLTEPLQVVELEPRPAPAVELQVLGPPRLIINDEEPQLRRSQSIELLAYLVTHPKGASTDKLLDVLFPTADNQRAKRPTLQQLSTEIRKLVGLELLPRARDGWYRTEVTSDEQRFTAHVADADAAGTDTDRAAHLWEAVNLVRGRPFETSADWMWAMTDGVVTNTIQRIHDAAHQLIQLEINLGRYDTADDAAAKGILADQHCDRCWDLRLQAAEAAGDAAHLRRLEEQRHRIAEAS
jgi:DNA-binding SARP family transcriptional activator